MHAGGQEVDHADQNTLKEKEAHLRSSDDANEIFPDHEPKVSTKDPFEEANVLRKAHRIKVAGTAPPPPLRSFADLNGMYGAPPRLLAHLAQEQFLEPTPIQRQAISAMLARRELLAVAPTGSGKTLSFLLPIIIHVWKSSKSQRSEHGAGGDEASRGIKALVVSPTKELTMQSARVLKVLLPGLRLRCSILSKATAAGTDFSKVDILLANPLRLGTMSLEGKIDLSSVEILVLDEADKLFDMGFTPQVDAVVAACTNRNIIRALFSATLPESVETMARSILRDPLRVTVGERNTAASNIDQKLIFVGRESGKLLALRQLITEGLKPPILVFVNTKERAKELHRELLYDGMHVDSLHAAQSQAARLSAVENFRSGKTWILVATDLIGRGMDFAGVNTVVNFDFPHTATEYIHRIGRTGRAGRSGKAVTFFMEEDIVHLRSVVNVMRAAGCQVPEWTLNLKKTRRSKRKGEVPEAKSNNANGKMTSSSKRSKKG
jgi:ATP-dependent RNA helicase DDX52/ROK1